MGRGLGSLGDKRLGLLVLDRAVARSSCAVVKRRLGVGVCGSSPLLGGTAAVRVGWRAEQCTDGERRAALRRRGQPQVTLRAGRTRLSRRRGTLGARARVLAVAADLVLGTTLTRVVRTAARRVGVRAAGVVLERAIWWGASVVARRVSRGRGAHDARSGGERRRVLRRGRLLAVVPVTVRRVRVVSARGARRWWAVVTIRRLTRGVRAAVRRHCRVEARVGGVTRVRCGGRRPVTGGRDSWGSVGVEGRVRWGAMGRGWRLRVGIVARRTTRRHWAVAIWEGSWVLGWVTSTRTAIGRTRAALVVTRVTGRRRTA
jgi:hypothetical protein